MKIVWTIVALLLLGGLIVLLQPSATGVRGADATAGTSGPSAPAVAEAPVAEPIPKPAEPKPAPAAEPMREPKAEPPQPVATSRPTEAPEPKPEGERGSRPEAGPLPEPKTVPKTGPTAEPKPAAVAEFRPEIPAIKEAELLPSRFVRLPDGGIAIDDAWTVRGEGTAESPYEVSWEFLSSAQDDYAPRLGEKKIRERIAFLSGKRVRISGYLAFPLVAPTASECLVMLNQWDGCCIGVPPTPYDAVEVKLAAELKGWKKHTINFGAVEGVFKVEPYLVENWLVGLYLLEGARINTEI